MMDTASAVSPGAPRALRWWSGSALAGLHRRLDGAWRSWCAGWGFDSGAVRCSNASEAATLYADVRHWYQAGRFGGDGVWIGILGHEPSGWIKRGAFGGAAADNPSTVAERVALDAWQDLQRELALAFDAAPPAERNVPGGLPAGHRLPWSGAVAAKLPLAGDIAEPLAVHLGPAVAAHRCGPVRSAGGLETVVRGGLLPVADALGHRRVMLDVHLGEAEIELGMLQSLRLGDVVTLSHGLEQPASVRWPASQGTDEHAVLFDGHLGRRGTRKAIEVVPHRPSSV